MPTDALDLSDADLELLVRAALTARTQQITEADLRPATPPSVPHPHAHRTDPPASAPSVTPIHGTRHRGHRGPRPALALAAAAAGVLALGGLAALVGANRTGHSSVVAERSPTPTQDTTSPPTLQGPDGLPPMVGATGGPTSTTPAPRTTGTPTTITFHARGDLARLSVRLVPTTEHVTATGATVTYPVLTVSTDDPNLAAAVQVALTSRIAALVHQFRTTASPQALADPATTQVITAVEGVSWAHTLTLVVQDVRTGPEKEPATATRAVVLDTRTGLPITADTLFSDVKAVDALMRQAIAAAQPAGVDIAGLTMATAPDDDFGPLTWYPDPQGLHWYLNPPSAPTGAGRGTPTTHPVTATVSWRTLIRYVNPDARP